MYSFVVKETLFDHQRRPIIPDRGSQTVKHLRQGVQCNASILPMSQNIGKHNQLQPMMTLCLTRAPKFSLPKSWETAQFENGPKLTVPSTRRIGDGSEAFRGRASLDSGTLTLRKQNEFLWQHHHRVHVLGELPSIRLFGIQGSLGPVHSLSKDDDSGSPPPGALVRSQCSSSSVDRVR